MTEPPEAYCRESVPRQLGALAASLARIASCARRPARSAVLPLLAECMVFIEHTAPRLDPDAGADLADLQVMLALWRESWPEAQTSPAQRGLLAFQAKKWSDQVLDSSGLLEAG